MRSKLALAIAQMEGYNKAGSRPNRNHNPGNLRASSLPNTKDAGGYCVFPDSETGWAALERQIGLDKNRGLTVEQFVHKYAPPTENHTENYIQFVCGRLGVARTTRLAELE
jgi:hypothetical protein